ncbi:TMV resistance protein N-like [Dorcoceras hygrometricum]|uniref:TMV resistance protein N-like n=1 Tax=Dorcoceras hygrometricum TaxID=472368 RepID=A0A2Z7ASY1_9LAMI|nr:TMV resistance protein N-like [Dorcoceras hygrometricum]
MVVDLIGIYGLKGPYCTLTKTDWFLQALSNSSVLLVQPDEGVSVLVVDRIGDYLPQSIEKSRVLVIPVGARHKCQQDRKTKNLEMTTRASRRARPRLPIARMSTRDMRADRAREASAGRNSTRDDGLDVRKRLRKWPVDAGGWVRALVAPPHTYVARIRRLPRRWLRALLRRWPHACVDGVSTMRDGWPIVVCRFVRSGQPLLQRWASPPHAGAAMCGMRWRNVGRWLRALPPRVFLVVAASPSAAAPASLQRCRDGWSEFLLGFGSVLSRAAREVFGPVCDVGPGFDRF